MMSKIEASVRIDPRVLRMAETVPKNLIDRVLPRAFARVVPIVRRAIIDKLPDGTESRKKQSEKSRKRFPHSLKKSVGVKSIGDQSGTLKIVGVTDKGMHVNFDHGNKAKTTGRLHKLWWVKGRREKFATPKLRKQNKDIPKIVRAETETRVVQIFTQTIEHAATSGELL